MDHLEILKRSFSITIKNKYLWFLGLLAGGGVGGLNLYNFNTSNIQNNFKVTGTGATAYAEAAGKILGDSVSNSINFSNTLWIVVITLILFFVLLVIYVSYVSKGAIVAAVNELDSGKKIGLNDSWKFGHMFFWRRLSFDLIIFLVVVVALSILAFPVIILAIFGHVVLAIVIGIILGLVAAVLLVYLSLIVPVAERVLFLERVATSKSFFRGSDIFRRNWLNYLLLYLIVVGVNALIVICLVFVLIIVALIVFGISALLALISHILSAVVVGVLVFCAVIALLAFIGAKQAFFSSILTLGYKSTIHNK